MKIDILTLFPAMFTSPFSESIIGRARSRGMVQIEVINLRDYALDRHQQVDDYPYGGGAGMVIKYDVVARAIQNHRDNGRVIYLSPQGKCLTQEKVISLAQEPNLLLLCGHYEGLDERAISLVDEEISVGDYILTGGEIAAMIVVDAVVRLLPGVLGDQTSSQEESFAGGLLEYPQYTRPRIYNEQEVPEILLSGHHENIRLWRKKQSLLRTLLKRPDLLLQKSFEPEERRLLEEIIFDKGTKKQ